MKILIADDHPLFRGMVRHVLASAFTKSTCIEVGTATEALELIRREDWDAVVLDVFMPGRTGLDILQDIRYAKPHLPVLIVTGHVDDEFVVRVFEAGANGLLTKDCSIQDLIEAARKITMGKKYISSAVAEILARRLQSPGMAKPHESLSGREYEVLCQLAQGRSVLWISKTLGLSPKTVQTYRRRLRAKLGVTTTAGLTRYAIQHHLIPSLAS